MYLPFASIITYSYARVVPLVTVVLLARLHVTTSCVFFSLSSIPCIISNIQFIPFREDDARVFHRLVYLATRHRPNPHHRDGVLIAIRVEKAYVAPLITLVLNLAIEMTMSLVYYETLHSPSSWNVLLPIPAFLIAYAFIGKRKTERHMENLS